MPKAKKAKAPSKKAPEAVETIVEDAMMVDAEANGEVTVDVEAEVEVEPVSAPAAKKARTKKAAAKPRRELRQEKAKRTKTVSAPSTSTQRSPGTIRIPARPATAPIAPLPPTLGLLGVPPIGFTSAPAQLPSPSHSASPLLSPTTTAISTPSTGSMRVNSPVALDEALTKVAKLEVIEEAEVAAPKVAPQPVAATRVSSRIQVKRAAGGA